MKKLCLLVLVMMLAAGMAFAANTSDVEQTGSGNTASVDQYGNNLADVNQDGNTNTANIDQGASGADVSNNHLPSYPGDWILGAFIDQLGSGNDASITMTKSSNGASIDQDGDGNIASMNIGTTQSKTTNWALMGLDIDQVGNTNEAYQTTIASFGCYGIQGMPIVQTGGNNYASQWSKGGMASTIEIFQTGNFNSSTQSQDARYSTSHAVIDGDNNITDQDQTYTVWSISGQDDACIDITGDYNNASQYQLGEYNIADIDILGDSNIASTSQMGGDSNYAFIDISSNGNTAMIDQDGMSNNAQVLVIP